jgi:DNA-binding MarR family transcriptional regulator
VDRESDQLNKEILDGVAELIGRIFARGEELAQRLSVPAVFIKVLHTLDCPMAMKDLGRRMKCDPSFVTVVADMLEKRGLAIRAAHPGDRRVKDLMLTSDGLALKRRIEAELSAWMPWARTLSDEERRQLAALIRKMLGAEADPPSAASAASAEPEPEPADRSDSAVPARPSPTAARTNGSPRAAAEEVQQPQP